MSYQINYHHQALKDLQNLNVNIQRRIVKNIEERLMIAPDIYGKPLRYSLKGLWSLKIGDYRVIYHVIKNNEIIVLKIGHRKEVYNQ